MPFSLIRLYSLIRFHSLIKISEYYKYSIIAGLWAYALTGLRTHGTANQMDHPDRKKSSKTSLSPIYKSRENSYNRNINKPHLTN